MRYEYTDSSGDQMYLGTASGAVRLVIPEADSCWIPNEEAPALALAILEAAGVDEKDGNVCSAVSDLIVYVRDRAERAEREAEDARVVAFWDALNPGYTIAEAAENIGVSDRVREQYRAAREFFKENP